MDAAKSEYDLQHSAYWDLVGRITDKYREKPLTDWICIESGTSFTWNPCRAYYEITDDQAHIIKEKR